MDELRKRIEEAVEAAGLPYRMEVLSKNLCAYIRDHDVQGRYREDILMAAALIKTMGEILNGES